MTNTTNGATFSLDTLTGCMVTPWTHHTAEIVVRQVWAGVREGVRPAGYSYEVAALIGESPIALAWRPSVALALLVAYEAGFEGLDEVAS